MEKIVCDVCGNECFLSKSHRLISSINTSTTIPQNPSLVATVIRDFCGYDCLMSFVSKFTSK